MSAPIGEIISKRALIKTLPVWFSQSVSPRKKIRIIFISALARSATRRTLQRNRILGALLLGIYVGWHVNEGARYDTATASVVNQFHNISMLALSSTETYSLGGWLLQLYTFEIKLLFTDSWASQKSSCCTSFKFFENTNQPWTYI